MQCSKPLPATKDAFSRKKLEKSISKDTNGSSDSIPNQSVERFSCPGQVNYEKVFTIHVLHSGRGVLKRYGRSIKTTKGSCSGKNLRKLKRSLSDVETSEVAPKSNKLKAAKGAKFSKRKTMKRSCSEDSLEEMTCYSQVVPEIAEPSSDSPSTDEDEIVPKPQRSWERTGRRNSQNECKSNSASPQPSTSYWPIEPMPVFPSEYILQCQAPKRKSGTKVLKVGDSVRRRLFSEKDDSKPATDVRSSTRSTKQKRPTKERNQRGGRDKQAKPVGLQKDKPEEIGTNVVEDLVNVPSPTDVEKEVAQKFCSHLFGTCERPLNNCLECDALVPLTYTEAQDEF